MKKLFLLLILSSAMLPGLAQTSPATPDTTAIRQLLEKEAATWRSGDVAAHASCWLLRPYSRILVSLGNGQVIDVPPQAIITPQPADMDLGGQVRLFDMRYHIAGQQAWVSHQEESISAKGQRTLSYEIRLLEKADGQWKLVGQSIHIQKPTQEP